MPCGTGGSITFGTITATGGTGTVDGNGGDVGAVNDGATSDITFAGTLNLGSTVASGNVTADSQRDIIATGAFNEVNDVTFETSGGTAAIDTVDFLREPAS